jgi:hypothetical protein
MTSSSGPKSKKGKKLARTRGEAESTVEAVRSSETSMNFYRTTLHYFPEGSNLHSHRCENLKSNVITLIYGNSLNGNMLTGCSRS